MTTQNPALAEPFQGLEHLAAQRVEELRAEAGCTQRLLADEMSRLGFNWSRETVAQIKGGRRRVFIGELIGLSIVFGEPVSTFLIPQEHSDWQEALLLPDGRALGAALAAQLIAGRSGQVGPGGASDWAAAELASGGPRPIAEALWRARRDGGRSEAVQPIQLIQAPEHAKEPA